MPEGTTAQPWMRVNDDYKEWNADKQSKDPESVLAFWGLAVKMRKEFLDLFVRLSSLHLENPPDAKQRLLLTMFFPRYTESSPSSTRMTPPTLRNQPSLRIPGSQRQPKRRWSC